MAIETGNDPDRRDQIKQERLERWALARLERFAELAKNLPPSVIPQWGKLAKLATSSALKDCQKIGKEKEALQILTKYSKGKT